MSKVFVGLSGGVDSAVSAALLRERGHAVVGAFIKIWRPEFSECSWREDRLDAMRVCAALGIPYRELDLSDAYKTSIVDSMLEAYRRGTTPNPDVLCNREIKFGRFAAWALECGAEMLATGHYARIRRQGGAFALRRAADASKDQSYFLHRLTQKDLARTLFPIGGLHKRDVRALAAKFGLPVAQKADSQGLCFIGNVTMSEFLSRYIPLKRGDVLDMRGRRIGEHSGAALYTVGQRHGFTTCVSEPLFVVATDMNENTLTVSPHRGDAERKEIRVSDMNWIVPKAARFSALAQARYREEPVPVVFDTNRAVFDAPHIAAPGQSLVLYDGDVCIGGGVIE